MAKQLVKNYTFSTSAKTITLTDLTTVRLDRLQLIVDATTNKILYNFADATVATATVATNVVTLSALQGGEANGDKLQIYYDALTTDGSFTDSTQPVSATSLPLPTGAATAVKQPALGTAGTASADVLSVQGVASMTALKVDGSAVTQPVSGSVTANVGTTGGVALDATLTGGTQQAKVTDGTNIANVLKSDGTSAGQNAAMTAGTHLAVAFTTTTAQAVASTDAANYAWVSVHITTQGGSSTVNFQSSHDNTNWVSTILSTASGSGTGTSATAAAIVYHGPLTGRYFRLNVTGIVSGTTAGVVEFFTAGRAPSVVNIAAGSTVAQSGTWTVQPGNTANSTPWLMTPAAGTTGGYSASHITTSTTTTVKSGAGTFRGLVINTKGATSTATIYDSTTGSGTVLAVVDTTVNVATLRYDVAFATGLTVVTAGGTPADLSVIYK